MKELNKKQTSDLLRTLIDGTNTLLEAAESTKSPYYFIQPIKEAYDNLAEAYIILNASYK